MDPESRIRQLENLVSELLVTQRSQVSPINAKFQARIQYDPPLSDAEMEIAWDMLPKGRKVTSLQYADLFPGYDREAKLKSSRRYLYWMSQKGIIKWDAHTKGYSVPTCRPF